MIIGKITKIEDRIATVETTYGEELLFAVHRKSVTHGDTFGLGDTVSVRMSRDNSRVASVVHHPPKP